jgi:hypothetical protein
MRSYTKRRGDDFGFKKDKLFGIKVSTVNNLF